MPQIDSDIAVGTRLAHGARVECGAKRELISRIYNGTLRTTPRTRFSDAQCGFTAVRAGVAESLLSEVRDQEWFFDTELLVLAQRRGLRIHEVHIVRTAWQDQRGVARLLVATPVARFVGVGVVSTLAYAVLFLILRGPIGPAFANGLLTLGLTTGALGVLHGLDASPARPLELAVLWSHRWWRP